MHTTTTNTRHAFTATTGSLVCATCGMTRGSVRHSYLGSNRHITKENPMPAKTAKTPWGLIQPATGQPTCMVCGTGMYVRHGETLTGAQRAVVSLWVADATHPEMGRHESFPVHAYCLRLVVVDRDEDPEAFDQQRAR